MSQENRPFENAIAGVAVREEFEREDCTCDARLDKEHDEECELSTELPCEQGLAGNDVFWSCPDLTDRFAKPLGRR